MLVPFGGDFLQDDEAIASLCKLALELFADFATYKEVCVNPAFTDEIPTCYRELEISGSEEGDRWDWVVTRALPPGWSAIEVSRLFCDGGSVYFHSVK